MLNSPYLPEPLGGPPPPSLPPGATDRYRPLVPVNIVGPTGLLRPFGRALLDTGADDTVFPLDTAQRIGVILQPNSGQRVRWRGQLYPLQFGLVELVLADEFSVCRWRAVIAFSPTLIRYPLLGECWCLQFFNSRFLGAALVAELDPNATYPGTTSLV